MSLLDIIDPDAAVQGAARERGLVWWGMGRDEREALTREIAAALAEIPEDDLHEGCVSSEHHGDGECVPVARLEEEHEEGFTEAKTRILEGVAKLAAAGRLEPAVAGMLVEKITAMEPTE